MFTSTHRDRRPGASLNRSRRTIIALWVAVIAAVLVPTLADAAPVSQSDSTAQAAHAKKQCKKGTHRKATRRHGKRHVRCVKNKKKSDSKQDVRPLDAPPSTPAPPGATPTNPLPNALPPVVPGGPPIGGGPVPPPPLSAVASSKARAAQSCQVGATSEWELGYYADYGYPNVWTRGWVLDCFSFTRVIITWWDGAQEHVWFAYDV